MRLRRAMSVMTSGAVTVALALVVLPVSQPGPSAEAAAVAVQDGFQLTQVRSGIQRPHSIRFAPDGRLFLLEQNGRVRIVRGGELITALTIDPAQIIEPGGSAGLLSIAFPPGFRTAEVQQVYLVYTHEPMPGFNYPHNVLSRFTIDGDTINPASEEILVHFDSLIGNDDVFKTMHYGGDMEFGADGKLYVSTGDLLIGPNAQNKQNLYGKILRYNADGTIPASNPFYDSLTGRLRAIWSIGVRNPFKLAYDKVTGRILFGDVGSSNWEEVNLLPPGEPAVNYGWSNTEGYTTNPLYRSPLLAYPHNPGLAGPGEPFGCAVMGGDIYRPKTRTFPKRYTGDFFFADHCQGWLRSIDTSTGAVGPVLVSGLELAVDMAVAPNGAVWLIQRELNGAANGVLYRLQYTGLGDVEPTISGQPEDLTVGIGMDATFSVFASGSGELSYQWFKDDVPIPGATLNSVTLPNASLEDSGAQITVEVTNAFGSDISSPATLTVLDDAPPDVSIDSPGVSKRFAGGERLRVRGSATDAEDGALSGAAFEWEVVLHHNQHTHPEFGPLSGQDGFNYRVPRVFETDPDVFLRIHCRVTDSAGITTEVTRDVQPKLTELSFATLPGGRSLVLDGSPVPTPLTTDAVVGISRTLSAPPTTVDNVDMVLDSWEDGSTLPSRSFWAPLRDHLYRAFYRVAGGTIGSGTGLRGTYFGAPDFTDPLKSRVDRVPYFTWGTKRPAKGVPADNFSVRWQGEVQGQFSENYTLSIPVSGDDAVKVEIDGDVIIDTFTSGATGTVTGSVPLTAGALVPITISFRDGSGAANLGLQWSSSSTPESAIPGSQLTPAP